jgi:hypothetical protein
MAAALSSEMRLRTIDMLDSLFGLFAAVPTTTLA